MHSFDFTTFKFLTYLSTTNYKLKDMKANIGSTDKIIRLSAAILIAILYYDEIITGTLAVVLGILALVLFITSFISFCPLYALMGMRTSKRSAQK